MRRRGAALTEFALIMPLLIFLTFGVMQLTLLAQARLVLGAAAVSAARAAIVDPYGRTLSPSRAAALACVRVAGPTLPGEGQARRAKGRKEQRRQERRPVSLAGRVLASTLKTRAQVTLSASEAAASVEHDLELLVPGVNRLFLWTGNLVRSRTASALYGTPHLTLSAKASLPAPWLGALGVRPGPWPAASPKPKRTRWRQR